jgi:hypothetical protein
MPKWKRNTFDITEDIIARGLMIINANTLFTDSVSPGEMSFTESPERIDKAFIVEKAVNDQKIFLIEGKVIFLAFSGGIRDMARKINP